MLKVAFFQGEDERGQHAFPLFGPGDRAFEKTASPYLLPEVARYIETLKPSPLSQYVLLNAMGAVEWWGSNINGDGFTESSLIHKPDDWTNNPLLDRVKAKDWAYGFPTFYFAHPYAHHRNKDATRAFGEVELAAWNPRMKRVELVTRVDKDKCERFGGTGVWDKLKNGDFPDVSMGCKVPFDTCSICLDWKRYRDAQASFDPRRHKTPGDAVLEVHKKKPIRGVSITRKDYCEHARSSMNRILPDGRKVCVYNDYPKFFDISFVFIGADKTAKTMMKIAGAGRAFWHVASSLELAEKLGYYDGDDPVTLSFRSEEAAEKTASAAGDELKLAFLGKQAKNKDAEIVKDTVPSQFAAKAIPVLTRGEEDLPKNLLDALSASPLEEALSTPTALGMVLRPREFQRIVLIQMGHAPLADRLEREGKVFPKVDDELPVPMGPGFFSPLLARLLLPMMGGRSAFGPSIEKRVLVTSDSPKEKQGATSSHSSDLLRKMGAAYNGYRTGVMELVTHAQDFMSSMATPSSELHKLSFAPVGDVFTPLSAHYLKLAFWDEVGVDQQASAGVERGLPSRNTRPVNKPGGYT